jgi:hypothetical protein
MLQRLLSIRISLIAWILLGFFMVVIATQHQAKLTAGQLALFSVNSFLFGYYFAPLLSAQKARVAGLITAGRSEEMAVLDILTQSHLLGKAERHKLKVRLRVYLSSIIGNTSVRADNPYYDELLYYTKSVHGKDEQVMGVIYDRVSKTQGNRDTMNNLFASKIYSHEWLVALVLFFITLYFALQTNFNGSVFFGIMLAILCTGLSLLMVIMVKFATLTHKEAKRMWVPLRELVVAHFDDVTEAEMVAERQRIDDYVATRKTLA